MLRLAVLCMSLLASVAALTCPDGRVTQEGSTCCLSASGVYTSCPLPHAVCCEDHVHCCSESTTCDLEHNKCVNATESLEMVKRVPTRLLLKSSQMVPAFSEDTNYRIMCADKTRCPTAYSCLNTADGFGCCRLKKGIPCSDGKHCCHKDHKCSEDGRFCIEEKDNKVFEKTRNVPCDDTSACPDDSTCCKTTTGKWACCPLPEAVCCDDHVHCCPHGTKCNPAGTSCDNSTSSIPWLEKLPPINRQSAKGQNVPCDDTSACPDDTTCCKTTTGKWGCCPMPEAICCEDQQHCCPKGYVCDMLVQTCRKSGSPSSPWQQKKPALKEMPTDLVSGSSESFRHKCGPYSSCPKDTTCCYMNKTSKWGCCPLPKAVCCEDGEHCCPSGYKCNVERTTCSHDTLVIPWYSKMEAQVDQVLHTPVECNMKDGCASGTPCYQLPSGQLRYCPMAKAVCCSDMQHCCPSGYTCDPVGGSCTKKAGLRWDSWDGFITKRKAFVHL
nr:granulins-like isoform X1 [Paramormyrops kingsleyae]